MTITHVDIIVRANLNARLRCLPSALYIQFFNTTILQKHIAERKGFYALL